MVDERLPWMKFYPQDWSGDEKLSMCSLAARGLLASCLHLMHAATPYGHLLIHGRKPNYDEIAQFARCKPREAKWGFEELIKCGAVSLTEDGVIYSRRMVRDAERRKRSQINGAKNPGNPKLLKPDSGLTHISDSGLTKNENSGLTPMASGLLSSRSVEMDEPEFQRKVGDLALMFPQVYLRVRRAHYQEKPVRDYPNYQTLARGWTLERLEKMLEMWLHMPAKEGLNVPGTPGQFANMAPECDRRLREHGL